jgi:hypothetical protein
MATSAIDWRLVDMIPSLLQESTNDLADLEGFGESSEKRVYSD